MNWRWRNSHFAKSPIAQKRSTYISDKITTAIKNVLKGFLPAWYLPNGTINAAENQLESASLSCELWGIWCAALVVVSVTAEFVIAISHPAYDSTFEIWGMALTDFFVAIGIVGEVSFGIWDGRIQTELRKRSNKELAEAKDRLGDIEMRNAFLEESAAMAAERAAKAELETERLRVQVGWRHISPEQAEEIVAALRAVSVKEIDLLVEYQNSDPEAWSYSFEIATIFGKAGIARIRRIANSHFGTIVFGMHMAGAPGVGAAHIAKAFTDAIVPVHVGEDKDLSTHLPRDEIAPTLYIFVGPKPPDVLAGWEMGTIPTPPTDAA